MPLKEYERKRKFSGKGKTNEPKGKISSSSKNIFVVHEHHASHLHWDLRLEMDGVLKSWAVPKEPPKDKEIKRLAIQVEDHPIAYASFHGMIPEGNYGAGTVKIWDNGKYEMLEKTPHSYKINFHGKKLKGEYVLVKTNYGGKKNSWLFFKI